MKAKDLMIGDWIIAYDVPRRVETIYNNGKIEADCIELSEEDFTPILITPEILKKNGFHHIADRYERDDLEFHLKECKWESCYIIEVLADEYGYGSVCSISYVHQLQHVLHLCGIEKEIEL